MILECTTVAGPGRSRKRCILDRSQRAPTPLRVLAAAREGCADRPGVLSGTGRRVPRAAPDRPGARHPPPSLGAAILRPGGTRALANERRRAPRRPADARRARGADAGAQRHGGVCPCRATLDRPTGTYVGSADDRHLDDRLDRTAQEALAKWEFSPALRNGRAVDVDAVFEIPFHLAPRPTK